MRMSAQVAWQARASHAGNELDTLIGGKLGLAK
jgi:hypothetical protein